MEGRPHTGVLFVLLNCQDPTQEAEWERWYDEVHIPDVTGLGFFTLGTRFRKVSGAAPGDARSLTVYETTRPDPCVAYEGQSQVFPSLPYERRMGHPPTQFCYRGVLRAAAHGGDGKGKKAKGVMVALSNCKDPRRAAEFERWYDQDHIPEVLETRTFYAATRYVSTLGEPVAPQYVVIYETNWDDPNAARETLRRARSGFKPSPETLEMLWLGTYQRAGA